MIKKLTGLTASLVALASTANASVKINDYLAIEGYVAASATVSDPDSGSSDESFIDSAANNLDSALFAFTGSYESFSGKLSLLYVPDDVGGTARVLDAYISFNAGAATITAGNYLSYMGYEAFHAGSMAQLTYGYASGIPAYRTGAKVDFVASETLSLGASITDSYNSQGALLNQGDEDWDNGLGYELVATYTGIDKLTVFLGLGVDDEDGATNEYALDFWVSYALTDKLTVAGEISYLDDANTSYIAFAQYAFTEKFSSVFRVSGTEDDATNELATYLTIAPAYALTENLTIRGEVSYADTDGASYGLVDKGFFYGVQGVFKF
jgi:opacity protein-like surface antigen